MRYKLADATHPATSSSRTGCATASRSARTSMSQRRRRRTPSASFRLRRRPEAPSPLRGGHPGGGGALGHSLEIVKYLGDAESVHETYGLADSRARTPSATCGWRRSRRSTSEARIPTGDPYSDVAVRSPRIHVAPPPPKRAGRRFISSATWRSSPSDLARRCRMARVSRKPWRSLDELDYVHVHRGDEGRARRREGRAGCKAARPLRPTISSRSRPRRSQSRQLVDHEIDTYDPYLRCSCGSGR